MMGLMTEKVPPSAKGRWGTDGTVDHRPKVFKDRKKGQDRRACRGKIDWT